ncbi:NAD(P)/FAD-dependent oxidoreductase [Lutibaculum baratangense]|uniref:NADH:ubiquinone reductase (non-electrogenic) n=1 Tax=Lutibaculum baratangense AMV1 TaxID=631454 RepID=V4RVD4_9HYPH|nr:NAD(P)/FAD-dependent oxidoreductase [Lutibaculum baratangense]ESR27005.1 NADH dehydrogenase [Lutibaculum baratangense AMV1]
MTEALEHRTDPTRLALPARPGPHVVIVGAGFGGIEVARELGRAGVAATIVDRQNHHLFQPLLYQVATAALSPAEIAEPIRKVLGRYPSVEVVLGEVVGVDTAARQVELKNGTAIRFDRLVLASGATHGYFGHDEWAEHAPGLKTIEDARKLRSRVLLAFEQAEVTPDPDEQRRLMTIAVIGGGPTGVEMAGALAELSRHALSRNFRRIDPSSARIILLEAAPRLLSGFPESLAAFAKERLERLGVETRLGQAVEDVGERHVTVAGERIPVGAVVWGAGVAASPGARWLGLEGDRAGRIRVGPDFQVPGLDGIHVIGDLALVDGEDGKPLPGLAQVAKQEGTHLGRGLARNLKSGEPLEPFRYRDRGNAAIVGRHAAVFDFGRYRLKGWFGWLLWAIVHVYLLSGAQNRIVVSLRWLLRYLTYERGARLIADDPGRKMPPPRRPDR